jgi:hypothetical protein
VVTCSGSKAGSSEYRMLFFGRDLQAGVHCVEFTVVALHSKSDAVR